MHELWIKNRSERDLCSCEGIVAKKTQKKKPQIFLGFLGNCSSCFTTAKITFISILLCHINCAGLCSVKTFDVKSVCKQRRTPVFLLSS